MSTWINKKFLIENKEGVMRNLLSAPLCIDGAEWYSQQRKTLQDIADKYGYSLEAVCKATSHLSPRMQWKVNLSAIEALCAAHSAGDDASIPQFRSQVEKAINVLEGKEANFGPKTENFWRNLMGCQESVTIDRHHIAIMGCKKKKITDAAYRLAQEYTRTAAAQRGYSPSKFQAALWVAAQG